MWSAEVEARVEAEIAARLGSAYRTDSAYPRPPAEAMFEHVYEELPVRIRRQRVRLIGE